MIKIRRTKYSDNRKRSKPQKKKEVVEDVENEEPNEEKFEGPTVEEQNDGDISVVSSITPNSPQFNVVPHVDMPDEGGVEGVGGDYWREKYHQLLQIRETEAEGLLREYHEMADKREDCMKELIQALQEKVEWLEKNPFSSVPSDEVVKEEEEMVKEEDDKEEKKRSCEEIISSLNQDREEYVTMLEGKVGKQRSLLLLYQMLSSLVISPYEVGDGLSEALSHHQPSLDDSTSEEDSKREVVTCLALNHIHQKVSKFNLSLPPSLSSLSDVPNEEEEEGRFEKIKHDHSSLFIL